MADQSQKEIAISLAKNAINFGVLVLVFCVVWPLQRAFFPTIFDTPQELTHLDSIETETAYVPILELDSADIENGIHLPTGLIVDTGCQEVMTTCGACHSLNLVTQNRATREGWKDIIVWMQETQKLWDLGEREPIILDYLSKNYAPTNSGRRKNLVGLEWYNL